jgi:aspartate carbamoyltransferase catalytic subunit
VTWDRKDLLGLRDLSAAEITAILDAAEPFKKGKASNSLSGRTVAFLFSEASTRTRSSFEVAARRLGAEVLGFSVANSSLLKGETLLDTVWNLEAMGVDYFIVRHEQSGVLEPLALRAKASLINAGDGAHEHPTQALLDLFTLREKWDGKIKGKKIVIVGDILHSRVARSNVHALSKFGAKITLCGPQALVPEGLAGPGIAVSHDLDRALEGADAVNVLRIQLERQKQNLITSVGDYFLAYGLTPKRLERAAPGCLVLHPGPMNRGVEISSEVADGPSSVILEQVANGVAVRMAVLSLLKPGRKNG